MSGEKKLEKHPFELIEYSDNAAKIIVIGVGGGGGNAVNHMVENGIKNVSFICANTDAQALSNSKADTNIQLGSEVTKGLGAGANPEIGRQAALEDTDRLREILEKADMVFITAGMGGGTGTGAAPIVAQIAKEVGALTVGVVTRPFPFEGRKRMLAAEEGIQSLAQHVDCLIVIPNEKLLTVLGKNVTLLDAFCTANDVLRNAVVGITSLIVDKGIINVDFADVRTVMSQKGAAMMGTGIAKGDNRARDAAEAAISSPLLDNTSNLSSARGVLVNLRGGMNVTMTEFEEVGDTIKSFTSEDAIVIVGTVIDPEMTDELSVTIVATGLGNTQTTGSSTSSGWNDERESDSRGSGDRSHRPASMQPKKSGIVNNLSARSKEMVTEDMDYLDIPAFLRRQSD